MGGGNFVDGWLSDLISVLVDFRHQSILYAINDTGANSTAKFNESERSQWEKVMQKCDGPYKWSCEQPNASPNNTTKHADFLLCRWHEFTCARK